MVAAQFITSFFDFSGDPPNPPNDIKGRAILVWLRERCAHRATLSAPESGEDWGWICAADNAGQRYMIGASAEPDEAGYACTVQVEKMRSMTDRMFGRNKMDADDPVAQAVLAALRGEPALGPIDV